MQISELENRSKALGSGFGVSGAVVTVGVSETLGALVVVGTGEVVVMTALVEFGKSVVFSVFDDWNALVKAVDSIEVVVCVFLDLSLPHEIKTARSKVVNRKSKSDFFIIYTFLSQSFDHDAIFLW